MDHKKLRDAVIASLEKGQKVKCMVWRDKETSNMVLVNTDADYDLLCKFIREKHKCFPLFTVLVETVPPTTPPPNGGDIVKIP